MGRSIRTGLVWAFGVMVALVILAGIAFFVLLARLDMRRELERAVENATGRETAIAGPVGVSVWPILGLRAQDVRVANATGGAAPHLADIGAVSVGVEIPPLIDGEVRVTELILERPVIALEVDAAGRPNWALQAASQAAPSPGRPSPQPQARAVTLRDVHVRDGAVSYLDRRTNAGWRLSDIDLDTALTSLDAPARLTGTLTYEGERAELEMRLASPRAAFSGRPFGVVATLASAPLQAGYAGQVNLANQSLTGEANARGPSLRRAMAWLAAPMPSGYGMEAFSASGRVRLSASALSFENAALAVDALRGRGDLELRERAGRPYASGRLELMDFDLNPYLASASQPQANAAQIAEAAQTPQSMVDVTSAPSQAALDFAGLRALDADLELTTHALRVQRMRIDRARLSFVLNQGFLAATLHDMALYGGSGRGRVELDARELDAVLRHDIVAQSIDANAFLVDAANFSTIEGRGEVTMNLVARGRTQAAMLRALDGRMAVELSSGALRGVDLGGVATTLRRALNNQLVAPSARTPLTGMSASFSVSNGVMASESLSFNTPQLRLRGQAVIDLPERAVDIYLAPQGSILAIPFRISGPWSGPRYAASGPNGRNAINARIRQIQAEARQALAPPR